jgi:hypothetical protein
MPKVTQGEAIDLQQKEVVFATDKHKYAGTGDELRVHPKLAEYLIGKGWAAKEKPKAATAAKTKE